MKIYDFAKISSSMRGWLEGHRYFMAIRALEFARRFHTGLRKDGITPEFQHQMEITSYLRTISDGLLYPEDTIAVGFLHDVVEDYGVSLQEIASLCNERVAHSVELVTNRLDKAAMFRAMGDDPIASVVKPADRMHNLQTMVGVFTLPKQEAYIRETEQHILPMMKTARKIFPEQVNAYQNMRHVLLSQSELLHAVHTSLNPVTTEIS